MKKADLGIQEDNLTAIVKMLEKVFADENVFYTKLKSFHWNVEDRNFRDFHLFFDELAALSLKHIDAVAERVRALGRHIPAYLALYLKNTQLKENTSGEMKTDKMMAELLSDYETQIKSLRKFIDRIDKLGDMGTTDFLTGILEEKEKNVWMARASNV